MINIKSYRLKINFNLKDISRVGGVKSQIWLSTTINSTRVRIYTRQLISPEHWIKSNRSEIGGGMAREDNSLGRVINKENKSINKALKRILSYCQDYINLVSYENLQTCGANTIELSPVTFKEYIESRIIGNDYLRRHNAEDFIKDYIKNKAKEVNPITSKRISNGTLYNHKNALNRLQQFATAKHTRISWEMFNNDFEKEFTSYLTERGFTPNTIAAQFSILKVWLNDAERRELINDKSFHNFKTSSRDVENIYLTEDEIRRMYELDMSDMVANNQSQIEETRDLFIVGCWTGLRYSDLHSLPCIAETDETINVRTQKTNKTVTIPLHPMVKEIYRKYNGKLPQPIDKGKALPHLRRCARKAGIINSVTINKTKGGRNIRSTKEKCDFIMNHTARRSFATNMYLKGVPTISIMAITGHTTEANFMKYIKISNEEHAKIVARAFAS